MNSLAAFNRILFALAVTVAAFRETPAEALVTGAQARAFLGGRTGKIVYLKGYDTKVYFVDFADSILTERVVSDDQYSLSPIISPDGSRVLYEQGSAIWIRDLVANSPSRIQIFIRPVKPGMTMEPHWWVDPKTKDEYVQFTTGNIDDHVWPPKSGGAYIQKIGKDSKPVGPLLQLMPFMMSAGRSKNGIWGATAHHSVGMYKFNPDRIDSAFYDGNNWLDNGVLLACNASISPSDDPARQSRMMHLTSGGTSMNGSVYDNHKAVIIRSWTDPDPDHPLWWMGLPGDRVENDGSGNVFWGAPEWSTDENYFTVTGTKDIDGVDTADLYIARLDYAADSRLLRVIGGPGKNVYSHLWIKNGVAPAKIRLDSASLSFNSYRKDSSNPPSQTVAAANIGDGTLPALTLGPLPKWLSVTITGNGTNTPKLVNSVHRDSVPQGEYHAKVSVTFGQGADSAAYNVSFRYSDPVLTALKAVPAHAVILPGDSVHLTALGVDQTGRSMPAADQPAVTWSGGDDIKPDANGWFRADTAAWRSYWAVGKAGSLICSTQVTVARRILRIDAGAASGQAVSGWFPDSTYPKDGTAGSAQDIPDLTALIDPAPSAAYGNWRQGFTAYRFPDLPDARYRTRMHFVSPAAKSSGTLDVTLEGTKVLDKYKLPSPADSSSRVADVREASVTVSDGNGLSLDAEGAAGAPALAALEIYDLGPPPVSLTFPNGGEKVMIGDTLAIRWQAEGTITSCGIQVSVDSGAKWIPITRRRSVGVGDPDWRNYLWVIPDSLDGISLATDKAMISVYDYFGSDRDKSNRAFTITSGSNAVKPALHKAPDGLSGLHLEGGMLLLDFEGRGPWRVLLVDPRGRLARSFEFSGSGSHALDLTGVARGVYRLSVTGMGQTRSRLLPLLP